MGAFEPENFQSEPTSLVDMRSIGAAPFYGVVIGTLVGIKSEAAPLVIFPSQPGSAALIARSVVSLCAEHVGKDVVLQFDRGDITQPIVMGVIRQDEGLQIDSKRDQLSIDVDGRRLVIGAKEEITLRCGKASITLTKAGKILLNGEYIQSHAKGVNRLKGGSVQLN